jgi:hypothetical protein
MFGGVLDSTLSNFCAGNYNHGVINILISKCTNKFKITGINNSGIFSNKFGFSCSHQLNDTPSILNLTIDSCDISGLISSIDSDVSSGGIFRSNVLCFNETSENNITIHKCTFDLYTEGVSVGILAGIRVNYGNDNSSINNFNVHYCTLKLAGNNAGLFAGFINNLSNGNSQTGINHVNIHRSLDRSKDYVLYVSSASYIIMPYNTDINEVNNINFRHINIYGQKQLLLQPDYLYSQKHIRYFN